jgi:hypothetical protein
VAPDNARQPTPGNGGRLYRIAHAVGPGSYFGHCGRKPLEHFWIAWYGPNTPERAFGYHVIGPGFVIEMGSVDASAQHLHTVYHDLGNVLGRVGA